MLGTVPVEWVIFYNNIYFLILRKPYGYMRMGYNLKDNVEEFVNVSFGRGGGVSACNTTFPRGVIYVLYSDF